MECPFGVFSSQAGAWRKTAFPDCRIFNGFIIRYFLGQRVPFRISPINKNKFMKCLCILGVLASLATAQAATVLSTTTKDDPSTLTSGGYGAYYGFSFDLDHMLLSSGEGISPNSTVFLQSLDIAKATNRTDATDGLYVTIFPPPLPRTERRSWGSPRPPLTWPEMAPETERPPGRRPCSIICSLIAA